MHSVHMCMYVGNHISLCICIFGPRLHITLIQCIACTNNVIMCIGVHFVDHHPGGLDQILYGAGRDITTVFKSYHPLSTYK